MRRATRAGELLRFDLALAAAWASETEKMARLRDAPRLLDPADAGDGRARRADAPRLFDPADAGDGRARRADAAPLFDSAPPRLAGFDEAGRGALAGPVVVGCVSFSPSFLASTERVTALLAGVDDSKSLSAKAREAALAAVMVCGRWSVGCAAASEIDRLGIVAAAALAARRAYRRLGIAADLAVFDRGLSLGQPVVLDGCPPPRGRQLGSSADSCRCRTPVRPTGDNALTLGGFPPGAAFTRGDTRSLHVAAASLVAKVTRDHLMVALDRSFAGYGLAQHKGYGTQGHRDALAERGPSSIHRLSFAGSADEADSQSC